VTSVPETRASLLLRIRDPKDQSAWAVFLQIYQPLIYRLARCRGVQDADAREVTQDVLMAVAGSIGHWEANPDRGSFRGWLATMTRNIVVNYLIRQSRHPRGRGDDDFVRWLEQRPDPSSEESAFFDREEERQIFLWAVDRIRPEFQEATWHAFWQTAVDGRDAAAVATELGVNVGVIYVSRSRVMKRLREFVQRNATNDFSPIKPTLKNKSS
jgi:RNA polymerase sigma factor (sigma-70 family)